MVERDNTKYSSPHQLALLRQRVAAAATTILASEPGGVLRIQVQVQDGLIEDVASTRESTMD